MDRNLALEATRVTEAAALAAARFMGHGDERLADQAAAAAMRQALDGLAIRGEVIVSETPVTETDPLSVGQIVGAGDGIAVDLAVSPLEGATITATGGANALSVLALANKGDLLRVPDVYMEKVAVGPGLPAGVVGLDRPVGDNLRAVAEARRVDVSELIVCILDRPRHASLIGSVRETGARIMLIADGDVSGVVATTLPDGIVDLYAGIGGAPQGVVAAAALACVGGQMQARLVIRDEADRRAAAAVGFGDPDRLLTLQELAGGEVMFAATGVTRGSLLRGVRRVGDRMATQSLVMRSRTGTVRWIEGHHRVPPGGHARGAAHDA